MHNDLDCVRVTTLVETYLALVVLDLETWKLQYRTSTAVKDLSVFLLVSH